MRGPFRFPLRSLHHYRARYTREGGVRIITFYGATIFHLFILDLFLGIFLDSHNNVIDCRDFGKDNLKSKIKIILAILVYWASL